MTTFPALPSRPAARSYLYVAAVGRSFTKIGISNNPPRRAESFPPQGRFKVVAAWHLPDGRALLIEQEVKRRFGGTELMEVGHLTVRKAVTDAINRRGWPKPKIAPAKLAAQMYMSDWKYRCHPENCMCRFHKFSRLKLQIMSKRIRSRLQPAEPLGLASHVQ